MSWRFRLYVAESYSLGLRVMLPRLRLGLARRLRALLLLFVCCLSCRARLSRVVCYQCLV